MTKRNTLILEIIKHLIEDEKEGQHTTATQQQLQSLAQSPSLAPEALQGISQELKSLKNSIHELQSQVTKIATPTASTQPQATTTTAKPTNGSLQQHFIQDALQAAEYRLQNLATGAFLAEGKSKDLFLWSNVLDNKVCVVFLQSKTEKDEGLVLPILAGQILSEIPWNTQNVEDILRIINRKVFDFYNRYPDLDKKVTAAVFFIDKKQAKVFFASANMHLYQISEDDFALLKGSEAFLGVPNTQFEAQTVNIKRGQDLCFFAGENTQALKAIWSENIDKTSEEKKQKINEWLKGQSQPDAILAVSF
ncbi:MAG: hypothetical protein JJT94_02340 [Bernardetiaceae bacterium]|nr:hypothetical protein [Bernardetiaceae bacterium]